MQAEESRDQLTGGQVARGPKIRTVMSSMTSVGPEVPWASLMGGSRVEGLGSRVRRSAVANRRPRCRISIGRGRASLDLEFRDEPLGLRDHHPQFAADGDKPPAFGDPLFDFGHGLRVESDRSSGFLAGGEDFLEHRLEGGGLGVAAVGTAHLGREVVGADEDGVDAGEAVNRFGVGGARWAIPSGGRRGSRRWPGRSSRRPRQQNSGRASSRRRSGFPAGGYLQAAMAALACSTVSTMGTTIPQTPASRALLMWSWLPQGTRQRGRSPLRR